MLVKRLTDQVINKISAGEVVERPASVLRELVDNSLDAGATSINIFLETGGHSLVRVLDNGSGMQRDDALLCFERHATSKISKAEDLFNIQTLGFRGEALSSIAAVSKVKLTTRDNASSLASEVVISGGKLLSQSSVSANVGTDISVQNLFFNTPARKKFLKTPAYEERKIKQWLTHFSIGQPQVHFRLFSEGEEKLNLAPRKDSLQRAKEIFPGNFVSFERNFDRVFVQGLIGHPGMATTQSESLLIIINRRVVSDRIIAKAARDGFMSALKHREIPVGCISLRVAPEELDVNVHPQKSEVKFRDSSQIYRAVYHAISDAVVEFRNPTHISESKRIVEPASFGTQTRFMHLASPSPANLSVFTPENEASLGSTAAIAQQFRFSELRFLGQALGCYLICVHADELVVVDMHAAHERINYNKIRERFSEKSIQNQHLLLPIEIKLGELSFQGLLNNQATLETFGFELDLSSEPVLKVLAVPAGLAQSKIETLLREVANLDLVDMAERKYQEVIDAIAARIACHSSIRSGQELQAEEVYALFADLDSADFSGACPHGRPVVVSFSRLAVENWFGRDR